jgi:hypothetical protein
MVRGLADASFNLSHVAVTALVNDTSFSYACPGPDVGTTADTGGSADRKGTYTRTSGTWVWAGDLGILGATSAALAAEAAVAVLQRQIYANADSIGAGGFRNGPNIWAPHYAELLIDRAYRIVGGRTRDGRNEDYADAVTTLEIAHPIYRTMVVDKNGLLVYGEKWPLIGSSSTTAMMALYQENNGTREQVYVQDPQARTYTLLSWDEAGDDLKGEVINDAAIWTNKNGGTKKSRASWVRRADTLAAGITDIEVVPLLGESLSVGTANGATVVTPLPLLPGRALGWANGPRPFQLEQIIGNAAPLDFNRIRDLADSREYLDAYGKGETQITRAIARYAATRPATTAVIGFTAGWGTANIAGLAKGTDAYALYEQTLAEICFWCRQRGLNVTVPAFMFEQGANNSATTYSLYDAALVQYQTDVETTAKRLTGQSGNIPLICAQPTFNGTNTGVYAQPPFVFLDRAISTPTKFICIGPDYFYNHSDHLHLDSPGYALQGEFFGRALVDLRAGSNVLPLYMVSAVRSALVVTVTFNRAIQVSTTRVSDPGNRGFGSLVNDSNNRTISSVAAPSGTTIAVTLNGTPAAGAKLPMASLVLDDTGSGPTTWERSPICDLSADIGYDGTVMRRHACVQQITIT